MRQRCPPFLHPDSLRCMRARCLFRLAPSPHTLSTGQREPVEHAHVYPDSGFAPEQSRLLNIVCQVDEKPASALRYGQRLRSAFGQRHALAKPYLRQAFDADGATVATRPDHTGSYISKLDGVPAPAGLEARVARCLAVTRPMIERPLRPVRPAPLFERGIVQSRALSQDLGNALIPGLAGIRSVLECPVKDTDILPRHEFAGQDGC